MVLHGDRTRKFMTLGPFPVLRPIAHFKNGSKTPAISKIDVNVFSRIKAATWDKQIDINQICSITSSVFLEQDYMVIFIVLHK